MRLLVRYWKKDRRVHSRPRTARQWLRRDGTGQTHLIPGFAGLLFAVMIRQNQPFVCWRRHLALFAAHVLEYSSALDARKARPARQRARPFGPPSGRFPRKKRRFPCRHAKILLQPLRRRSFSRRRTCEPYGERQQRLATDEDSNWLRKIISKEIAVAIRSGAVLIRSSAVLICTPPCGYS